MEFKNIGPVTPEALKSFISFGIDRIGFENVADILDMLLGMKEDDVKDVYEGKLNVFPQINGGLVLSSIENEKEVVAKNKGTRESNIIERSRVIRELFTKGMDAHSISKTTGMCVATVRKYINIKPEYLVNKAKGTKSTFATRDMWTTEMKTDGDGMVMLYAFKNGSCADAARKLNWGWLAPNGDVFGGTCEYNGKLMLHDNAADIICEKEHIGDDDSLNCYSKLENLGWIKFENGLICADLDISKENPDNPLWQSVAPLITDEQQKFVADYMESVYMTKHTMPKLGLTSREYPITYINVRSMDLDMFRNIVTH